MKKLALFLFLFVPSCNSMETIRLLSHRYQNPVIFSDNWHAQRAYKKQHKP